MSSREQLYYDYVTELKIYNPNLIFVDNDQIFKNYKEVAAFTDLEWIDIYAGMECVGFILLANGPHCPVNYDWFIMECYIAPEFRRRNLMTDALNKLFSSHHGTFGLFILSANIVASIFWNKQLSRTAISPNLQLKRIPVDKTSVPSSVNCYELAFEIVAENSGSRNNRAQTIPSFD